MFLPEKIAFVDIETTGLSVTRDRVIEVGILRVENNSLVSSYQTVLNPEIHISPTIFGMTGITADEIEKAPAFYEVHENIQELLQDCVFVAHNVRFDYGFLRNEFRRLGITFASKHFCTVKLFRALYPSQRRHNLDSVIDMFGLQCERRHRAFDDAKVLFDFYQRIQKELPEEKILSAVKFAMKTPSLPKNISSEIVAGLPESPGVYIFYGADGAPLYVGKSVNVRDRVLSHFSSDHLSSKEMKLSQQVESIEAIPTRGELGALLKESYLVKKLQPIYNRQLRMARKVIVLKKITNDKGYHEVLLETADTIYAADAENILAVFKSQRQAKAFLISLVKQYSLCEKLLTLQKTKTSCFAYQLGYCQGACIEKEIPLRYNMRFVEAFSKNKIKTWPFPGPIVITEKDEDGDAFESFLIHKWCVLDNSKTGEFENTTSIERDYVFDVDTYKILVQYLRKGKYERNIRILTAQNHFLFSPH